MRPAIVIPAFSRPLALERLLASLLQAHYPEPVPLVLSIDRAAEDASEQRKADNAAVRQLAQAFVWPHGPKEVIEHADHLGLIGNVFYCGALSQQYEAVILLEDDLYVSQAFYRYAVQAVDFYRDDPRIAGISLNALWFNGYTHQPFIPYLDDSDLFFLPIAWYQGQVYTADQWAAFAEWYATADHRITPADPLHELFGRFPSTDWFPIKTKYLVNSGRYYAFPRESLTTNFGEVGTHFRRPTTFFQVPLQHYRQQFRFLPLDESIAVYDTFYEMLPDRLNRLTNLFHGKAYDVDLHATKSAAQLQSEYVLTTRPGRNPLFRFGQVMRPIEANIVANVPGDEIVFCRREDVDMSKLETMTAQQRNHEYAYRYRPFGRRWRALYGLRRLLALRRRLRWLQWRD